MRDLGTFVARFAAAHLSWKELFARHPTRFGNAGPEFWAYMILAALAGVLATLNVSHAHFVASLRIVGVNCEFARRASRPADQ